MSVLAEKAPRSLFTSQGRELNSHSPAIAATIRPHHALDEHVRVALTGYEDPASLAKKFTSGLLLGNRKYGDSSGYYHDVLGKAQEGLPRFEKLACDYFSKLRHLPDDSWIHLDIKRDEICRGCFIGLHCSGTRYQSVFPPRDTEKSESYCLDMIRLKLELGGYAEDVDFINQETIHRLFDFDGNTINQPRGKLAIISFNSIVVKTSALRFISKY